MVGYENVFQIMRILKLPYKELEQQFRRMFFNEITKNVDDHVKNISYTMDTSGQWKLSPAYDLTFSFNQEDGLGNCHKMTINAKQDHFTFDDFNDVAQNMEIKKSEEIVNDILSIVSKWPDFAKEARVSTAAIDYIRYLHLSEQSLEQGLSAR